MNEIRAPHMKLHPSIIFAGSMKKIITMLLISGIYLILHQNYIMTLSVNVRGIIVASMLLSIGRSYFFWKNFSYCFDGGHLIINNGIWFKNKRSIAINRISNMDVRVSLWQRIFGVAELRLDTEGGEREALIKLAAVNHSEVKRIKAIINYQESENAIAWQLKPSSIIYYGLTTMKLGYLCSFILFVYFQLDFIRDSRNVIALEKSLSAIEPTMRIAIYTTLLLTLSILLSVFFAFFRFHRFRVLMHDQSLQIKSGLVNTHTVTINRDNIAAIRIEESLLRQPFQVCTVYLDCVSGGNEEESSSTILIPWVSKKALAPLLQNYFPNFDFSVLERKLDDTSLKLYRAPARSFLSFSLIKLTAGFCIWLILGQFVMLQSYMTMMAAAAFLVVILWSYLQYKDHAISLTNLGQLSFSTRFIHKKTIFIRKNSLQQISFHRSFIQKLSNLTTIAFIVRTSAFRKNHRVRHLGNHSISLVSKWFSTDDNQ
ncbi:PH domain-containing protein [Candidatus Pristimantibacillus sp. PTI5]|uniref:PH domain-containing protein n=1 Tax=Candidatus Pristimantibacillus sp. PTI5 TaxID=3400422 RepID=UPI003B01511B